MVPMCTQESTGMGVLKCGEPTMSTTCSQQPPRTHRQILDFMLLRRFLWERLTPNSTSNNSVSQNAQLSHRHACPFERPVHPMTTGRKGQSLKFPCATALAGANEHQGAGNANATCATHNEPKRCHCTPPAPLKARPSVRDGAGAVAQEEAVFSPARRGEYVPHPNLGHTRNSLGRGGRTARTKGTKCCKLCSFCGPRHGRRLALLRLALAWLAPAPLQVFADCLCLPWRPSRCSSTSPAFARPLTNLWVATRTGSPPLRRKGWAPPLRPPMVISYAPLGRVSRTHHSKHRCICAM